MPDPQPRSLPPPPWRVFLSHTSELRDYPSGGESYVSQAERAVAMAGHVVVDMREFPARHHPPAQLCEERVRGCDVYVGIYGLRYGSPVRERPELSYTELEFMVAGAAGLPRLIFLLNPSSSDLKLPAKALLDRRHGDRQDAFRQRVREQGLTTALFSGPEELRLGIYQALVELAAPPDAAPVRSSRGPASRGPSGRDSAQRGGSHDAPPDLELLAYLPDRHPQEQQLLDLLTPPRQTPSTATAKVVILHGEEDQRLEWFRRRFLPDARRFDKPPRFFPVAWPRDSPADETFQEAFQRHLRSQVVKDLPLEALRGVLENGVRPVVLISSLSASEWSPREVRRLEALCRFWSADGPFAASWLLHWITITYDKLPPSRSASHRPGLWRWLTLRRWRHRFHRWRRARHNDWIRASLSKLARAPAVAARPVVLPEVRSVSRGDAESWARSLAVRQAVGRHHVTRLEQAVMERYRDWLAEHGVAEMPMEVLAPFLKEQVDQLRRRP